MNALERSYPLRGEIWWMHFPSDPPGKNRPGVVVSVDARNAHPRALTVLAVPLSTSIHKLGVYHLLFRSGETGLREDSVAWPENISPVLREMLIGPVQGHRRVTDTQICRLSELVKLAMDCA